MARRFWPVVPLAAALAACGGADGAGLEVGPPVEASARTDGAAALAVTRVATGNPPHRDVVLFSPEGRALRRVAPDAAGFSGPAWSPDGRRLAYVAAGGRWTDADPPTDVFTVDVASGRSRRLTRFGDAIAPVWSPDGRTIVFSRFRLESGAAPEAWLWAVDADGSSPRALTPPQPGRIDTASSFSPDGASLAVTRRWWTESASERQELRILDTGSLEPRAVIERARDGAFSPDGRRLAYASDRDENGDQSFGDVARFAKELYVRDLAGGEDTRVTSTRDLDEGAPAWSPDGGLLAYQRGRATGNASGTVVMTMRPDGSCPRLVVFDPGLGIWYSQPSWHPAKPAGEEHLRCRPSPRAPSLAPLAGNLSLDAARRFRPFRVLWLGRRFGNLVLSAIWRDTSAVKRGRGPVVHLTYGSMQLQLWHACVRVPRDLDVPADGGMHARGVSVAFYEGGSRMELVTGRSTVVAFGSPAQLREALRALRPVGAARPAHRLPPPAPGALEGRLRCR